MSLINSLLGMKGETMTTNNGKDELPASYIWWSKGAHLAIACLAGYLLCLYIMKVNLSELPVLIVRGFLFVSMNCAVTLLAFIIATIIAFKALIQNDINFGNAFSKSMPILTFMIILEIILLFLHIIFAIIYIIYNNHMDSLMLLGWCLCSFVISFFILMSIFVTIIARWDIYLYKKESVSN